MNINESQLFFHWNVFINSEKHRNIYVMIVIHIFCANILFVLNAFYIFYHTITSLVLEIMNMIRLVIVEVSLKAAYVDTFRARHKTYFSLAHKVHKHCLRIMIINIFLICRHYVKRRANLPCREFVTIVE